MSIIQEALKKAQGVEKKAVLSVKADHEPSREPAGKEILAAAGIARKAPRKNNLPLIFVIAVAAIAAVGAASFIAFNRPTAPAKPARPAKPADTAPVQTPKVLPAMEPVKTQTPPETPARSDAPAFNLSGIMYIESAPKAIVNGTMVMEGDIIGGATVKKISKTSVFLTYEDKEIQLSLY